mmetsp:Transcript_24777/g.68950  ORF Transcript_24777/g.68950 Transcript_24777/m.68950 type:complete len:214 (-) Transcript_24777:7-648(-)
MGRLRAQRESMLSSRMLGVQACMFVVVCRVACMLGILLWRTSSNCACRSFVDDQHVWYVGIVQAWPSPVLRCRLQVISRDGTPTIDPHVVGAGIGDAADLDGILRGAMLFFVSLHLSISHLPSSSSLDHGPLLSIMSCADTFRLVSSLRHTDGSLPAITDAIPIVIIVNSALHQRSSIVLIVDSTFICPPPSHATLQHHLPSTSFLRRSCCLV